ncbi:GAF domain-like protein [Usnea florida]
MVHADSSHFAPGASKREKYTQLHSSAQALFLDQRNWVCNLANTSSLLWHLYHSLPPPSSHVNWAGFYTLDRTRPSSLILGPFHGRPACQSIAIGRGVCGAAAASKKVVRVEDVREFPGHIACDGESRSEIVVPVLGREGEVSFGGRRRERGWV